MTHQELTDNHKRIITSRIQLMEQTMLEIRQLLRQSDHPVLSGVEMSVSAETAEELSEQLAGIQSVLGEIAARCRLEFEKKNQRRLIAARLNTLLNITLDMYADKLAVYGRFNPNLKKSYNKDVEKLEEKINRALQTFRKK
jgi:hypothetical protein